LQVTARAILGAKPRIVLYASVAGGAFQRVPGSETLNDTTVDTVNIVVTSTSASAPQLYTTPGATQGLTRLPKQIPPPLNVLVTRNDRYVGVDDTGNGVWFSGGYIYGEAVWWDSAFQFPVDAGRPITALGATEAGIVVFKRDQIFFVGGDGPDDTGAGFYGLPQEFPCGGAGCIEPRSVVNTNKGLFYQADQGIYLLSRGGEAQFIGSGVEQTLVTYPTVTSAVINQNRGVAQVVFTAKNNLTDGRRVCYDLKHDTWSTDVVGDGIIDSPVPFDSAVMVGGQISGGETWYGLASGQIFFETPGNYLDTADQVWQPTTIQTSWIKLDGEQGYNRVRNVTLLAQRLTGHDLTISVAYDYNPAVVDARTFTAAELAALTTREQVGVSFSRQKIQAVQITINDATPSSGVVGTGQGAIFLGLAFEVQPKGGTYRLPAANMK
jgi:hypothetical protein